MLPFDTRGLPARAKLGPNGLHVVLADIATSELRDPFLQETVSRVGATQDLIHVPRADLGQVPTSSAPVGLIFHIARCGSTLASQLLKYCDNVVVYSEPLSINEILVPPHAATRTEMVAALRTLGALLHAHAGGPHLLKLSSWNTLWCDLVAEAFPQTPWALCVRDPLEVGVSLLAQRPGWLRDESAALFADIIDPQRLSRSAEERIARTIAAFCEAAGRLEAKRGLIVPYQSMPDAVWQRVAPHFGLSVSATAQHRMAEASSHYSKAPVGRLTTTFAPDAERKTSGASPAFRQAIDLLARPAYERLIARESD